MSSGNSYVVPLSPTDASVITSWRHNATAGEEQMLKMKIWRLVGLADLMVVGHDGPRDLTGGALNGFRRGSQCGARMSSGLTAKTPQMSTTHASSPPLGPGPFGDFGDQPDGAETQFLNVVENFRVNATAVLEPDADADGFGDETQDQCPTDASTQGQCDGGGGGGGGGGGNGGGGGGGVPPPDGVPPQEGGPRTISPSAS